VRDEKEFVIGIDEKNNVKKDVKVWDNSNSNKYGDS